MQNKMFWTINYFCCAVVAHYSVHSEWPFSQRKSEEEEKNVLTNRRDRDCVCMC